MLFVTRMQGGLMQANRRRVLGLALIGAMVWCAPGVLAGEAAPVGSELTRLTLAVPGMT
jgi:hypothetical protein